MKSKILGLLAVGLLALVSTNSNAVVVTISGAGSADGQWEVSTLTGTSTNLLPTLDDQIWYGDESLAAQFTSTLAGGLGFPNTNGNRGPAFLFCFSQAATCQGFNGSTGLTDAGYRWSSLGNLVGFAGFSNISMTYAVANRVATVPEPGTLALLGLGLAGLGLSRRRKA